MAWLTRESALELSEVISMRLPFATNGRTVDSAASLKKSDSH